MTCACARDLLLMEQELDLLRAARSPLTSEEEDANEPSHRQHEGRIDPERMAADFALNYGKAYPKTYHDVLALEADLLRFLRDWEAGL